MVLRVLRVQMGKAAKRCGSICDSFLHQELQYIFIYLQIEVFIRLRYLILPPGGSFLLLCFRVRWEQRA